MASDSKGYYAALGLSPGASIAVVKAVYRQLAKECHPDTSRHGDDGAQFRRITEAYNALLNPDFKASYDRDDGQPAAPHTERAPQIDPVICQVCRKVTAQPRRLGFWRVTGFLVGTQKSPVQRIYCRGCAAKEQWRSTLWTSLLGWWGVPWGPIWSTMHGITNAIGGTREREVDEALMFQSALAFAVRGEGQLAVGLSNILRKSENAEIGQRSAEIIRFYGDRGIDASTTLKNVWKGSLANTLALFGTAFAVPAAAAALLFTSPHFLSSESFDASTAQVEQEGSINLVDADHAVPTYSTSAATSEPPTIPEPTCETPPRNAEVLVDHRGDGDAGHKIEIDNGSQGDAIIKVRHANSNKLLASFFVSRGQSASLENIPDGEYKIQYAVGDKLAPNCQSFTQTDGASASEFPGSDLFQTRFEDGLDGTRIIRNRLTYTLYSVPHGNVRPSSINLEDFDRP